MFPKVQFLQQHKFRTNVSLVISILQLDYKAVLGAETQQAYGIERGPRGL